MVATRRLTQLSDGATSRLRLPGGPVSVALSGGADSAALAYLLARSHAEAGAVHVHHGFHASDMLAAAAEAIAANLDIELVIVSVTVGPGASPELQARIARYEALSRVPGAVVTGHTRDDNVETMLINLVRGTGADGLRGIPWHRPPNVFRPLLDVTRSETREIATLADLPFRDDPMNDDMRLTRNAVRSRLLPRLRDLNPQIQEAMARTAAALRSDSELLEELVPTVDLSRNLPWGIVTTLPRPLADRLLRQWLVRHDVEIDADLLERVWSVAEGRSERQDLAGGRIVYRDRALLAVR